MWSITQHWFVSIVEKPEDRARDTLTVRSRDRQSLENFAKTAGIPLNEVKEKTETDYPFRLVASREKVEYAAAQAVREIHYTNFKNQAKKVRGERFASFLGRVWSAGWSLTPRDVQKRSDAQYRSLLTPARQGTGKKKSKQQKSADDYLDEIRWGTLPSEDWAGAPNHHEHDGFENPYEPITEDDWASIMAEIPPAPEVPDF